MVVCESLSSVTGIDSTLVVYVSHLCNWRVGGTVVAHVSLTSVTEVAVAQW